MEEISADVGLPDDEQPHRDGRPAARAQEVARGDPAGVLDASARLAHAQGATPNPHGPGAILELIRSGRAITRTQIMQTTGLSRSTVALRVETLLAAGYISPAAFESSTGGRPPGSFQLNR